MSEEKKMNGFWGVVILLLAKIGGKLSGVFGILAKSTKFVKVAAAGSSMVAYSYLLTWEFAIMIMSMLFVHESGHVWAMRNRGIKTKGFYFIPLIGGAAVAEESFKTRDNESYVALMGPMWGLYMTLASFAIFWATEMSLLASVTSWFAMLNLLNLLPINPLDGGRVTKSVAFSFKSSFAVNLMFLLSMMGIVFAGMAGMGIFVLFGIIGMAEVIGEMIKAGKDNFLVVISHYLSQFVGAFFKVLLAYPVLLFAKYVFKKKRWADKHWGVEIKDYDEHRKDVLLTHRYFEEELAKIQSAKIMNGRELLEASFPDVSAEHSMAISDLKYSYRVNLSGLDNLAHDFEWQRNSQGSIDAEVYTTGMLQLADVKERLYQEAVAKMEEARDKCLPEWEQHIVNHSPMPPMSRTHAWASLGIYFGQIVIYYTIIKLLSDYPDATHALHVLS